MQKSLRYSASIYSRRSLGGAVMSKPGNSEQARVEWICSTMVLHLLWKLGCLGDPWPDACWLYHHAWSPHPPPPALTRREQQQMYKLSKVRKGKVNKK